MTDIYKNLITYLVSPVSIIAGMAILIKLSRQFGRFEIRLDNLEEKFEKMDKRFEEMDKKFEKMNEKINLLAMTINKVTKAVLEIRTVLAAKFNLSFNQDLGEVYGVGNSPMVLRPKFKKYVKNSGLDKELNSNLPKLTKWLKNKNPETGLDAQKEVISLVNSLEIDKYLNTVNFKKHLYKEGLSPSAYYGILTFLLFETVIPTVIKE